MNAYTVLKYTAPFIARCSGMSRALALRYAGPGTIFGLHSVVDDTTSYPDEFLRCPAPVLEYTLSWLKGNGVQVVHLDEAIKLLAQSSTDRFCVFTFDDGYADNLTHVLPIMERFEAPFTIYIAAGMLSGEIDAWWLGLAELIRSRNHIDFPKFGFRFECTDEAEKKRAFAAITALIDSRPEALAAVKMAVAASGIDSRALARADGLSAQQLRQLAASPLVTVGAHGVRHIRLVDVSPAEVEEEMSASRRLLEDIVDRDVAHFAYPFGACGKREAHIAHSAGFRTAVTTQRGTLFPQHLNHLHELPREPIVSTETASTIRCKIDGTYRALHSKLGDPVAHM
jgi:peptidoglycan/xylan/chitin deacetylase (PgdA/CDA1 family)